MISRRHILKSGALVAFGSFLPGWARRAMAEEAPASRKVLVFLFLRGALDGLHAVTPIGEPRFDQLRPQRALQGAPDALAFASLDQLRLHPPAARGAFEAMYGRQPDEPVANSGKEAFAALDLLERKLPPQSSVQYPNGPIGNSLKQLARLI